RPAADTVGYRRGHPSPRLLDPGDRLPLPDHRLLGYQQPDRARPRRRHLGGDLLHLHLGDDLVLGHGLAVLDEPARHHTLRVLVLGGHGGEDDLGHVRHTAVTAALIRCGVGSTACSSGRAYGIGTSGTATR